MVRLLTGILFAFCGLTLAALSVSALSVVGTEEVTTTEVFEPSEGAYAVVLDEAIVPFEHAHATLTVSSDQELFLGAANGVDVDDYLTGVAHEEITDVEFPRTAHHRLIAGEPQPPAQAPGRDWWTATDEGTTVSRTFDLDADPQVIVITAADADATLEGAEVTLSMRVAEVLGLALLGFAGAAVLVGLSVFLFLRMWGTRIRPRPKHPGRRGRRGRRGTLAAVAGVSAGGMLLAGCGTDFPQPTRPELTPYERPALEPGQAGEFLSSYSERLDGALREDEDALDDVQGGPLLERTRAELLMAEHRDSTLGAAGYSDVRAGGPVFDAYPLWFMAFAAPQEDESADETAGDSSSGDDDSGDESGDEDAADSGGTVDAMLATRDSASAEWSVVQSVRVPEAQIPAVLADERGVVEEAPEEHREIAEDVTGDAVEFLSTGEGQDDGPVFADAGFQDFRDYVDELGADDTGFEDLSVECAPYEDMALENYALATEDGGISFAEIRCSITVDVPSDYFVDLGDEIEALMTTDDSGSNIRIDVAQPMLITTAGAVAEVSSPGWYMLSTSTGD